MDIPIFPRAVRLVNLGNSMILFKLPRLSIADGRQGIKVQGLTRKTVQILLFKYEGVRGVSRPIADVGAFCARFQSAVFHILILFAPSGACSTTTCPQLAWGMGCILRRFALGRDSHATSGDTKSLRYTPYSRRLCRRYPVCRCAPV